MHAVKDTLALVLQFETIAFQWRHPEGPRLHQRAEGSPVAHSMVAGDPSLRRNDNGCPGHPPFRKLRERMLPASHVS